ncbi:MAG: pyridoxine 5'-phosphate synthase [Vicinamibacteria bacterium]|nr:pyridoxine 5'-phosphate synthase [Vicinamibacteria bacterium]
MTKLSVNVNKIATLRNTRTNGIPDLIRLATIALDAGADGITVHPRPDQRHIRSEDVDTVAALLAKHPKAEYNIEGNPFHGLIEHCERVRPNQATLVPDRHDDLTSSHGWNLVELGADERDALRVAVARLHSAGCRVSLFLDPVPQMMRFAKALEADRIELYTEPYAVDFSQGRAESSVAAYSAAAGEALNQGLGINAGHDLNLHNLELFLGRLPQVDEVSIGHALIADAIEYGLTETVRMYRAICAQAR